MIPFFRSSSNAVPPEAIRPDSGEASYQVGQARFGLWHGAREWGETGIEIAEGCLAFSVFEIPCVPDFSSSRFPDLAGLNEVQRIEQVGKRQSQFLTALHSLGPYFGLSLRYFTDGTGKIRLFLIGRNYGRTQPEAEGGLVRFRNQVRQSFPSYYRLTDLRSSGEEGEVARAVCNLAGVTSIVEILKPEQVIPAWHDPGICGFSFYYFPMPFAASGNDMVEFCHGLTRLGPESQACVDISILPASPLTMAERQELADWTKRCERWGREQKVTISAGLYSESQTVELAADPEAQNARKGYEALVQNYGNPQVPYFIYGIRVLWGRQSPPQEIASSLASLATDTKGTPHLRSLNNHDPAFEKALNAVRCCAVSPAICDDRIWQHPHAPETIRRLHRLVDVREASSFFRFPIPGRDGCPGISLDTGLEAQPGRFRANEQPLIIGRFMEGHRETEERALFNLKDLTKHCLIVGFSGSGKTTLSFSLLTQLWRDHHLPFIVLEPAKTEYRALKELDCFRNDLLIFTIGNERLSPFRYNPFEILNGFNVSEHISALNTCLTGAFSMWDPLPQIIDQAIREVYADREWSEYGIGGEDPDLESPTIENFYNKALEIAQSKSYKGETAGNIRGALETRIGALLRGPKGRCFSARRSIPFNILMERPVILELDALNDQEQALMMMFILAQVRAYAKTTRRSGTPLKHVLLVEEAHNLIGRGDQQGGNENQANPKAVSIRFFTQMLAEMRALGEGIIIADQSPTAIASEAIKSTNIKVMHRLVDAEDRVDLGRAMLFDDGQIEMAAQLTPGYSYLYQEGMARARLVKEPNFKEEAGQGLDVPPNNQQVKEWMVEFQTTDDMRQVFLPYAGCLDVCTVCNPRIREQSERIIERRKPAIAAALAKPFSKKQDPVITALLICRAEVVAPSSDPICSGCLVTHFREKIMSNISSNKTK